MTRSGISPFDTRISSSGSSSTQRMIFIELTIISLHLVLFADPTKLVHEILLHVNRERDRSSESHGSQPQEVANENYERGRLRLNADIVVRLANALEVATDELLQPNGQKHSLRRKPSLRVLRRLEKIEKLPAHQQSTLLKTIDTFLRGAAASR
jgi:hypothetical protein